MNCETATSRVFPYVDGELPPAMLPEMDAHMAGCPSCRRLVAQEVAFRDAYVARLRPDPAPSHVRVKAQNGIDSLLGLRQPAKVAYTVASDRPVP